MISYGECGWSQVREENPVVVTKNGRIRGFNRNGNGVFLGIPYGGSCDGEKRFKAPEPVENWQGMRDCTANGPVAMQETAVDISLLPEPMGKIVQDFSDHFTGGVSYDKSTDVCSENCLVLNIVTPGIDTKKRPVMVYIHGGGYASGSGNVTAAICDRLADEEDVVIVTVNHRLNVFGFLYLGGFDAEYSDSGLAGQLDLVLALEWIRDNIHSFGGDPENVTLVGESGGGIKIAHLMAMPAARGLFSKAISISGSLKVGALTKEEGHRQTLAIMKELGISEEDWKSLLEVPAEKLLKSAGTVLGAELILPDYTPYMPVADGVHLPLNPEKNYKAYEVSDEVSLLVGASEEELAMNIQINPQMTWEDVRSCLLRGSLDHIVPMPGLNESNVDAVVETFCEACGDQKQPWQIYVQILSMCHFLGGGAFKAAMTKAARKKAPVWHYMTTYDAPLPGPFPLACAWHTADLPLVFRAVYHKEAEALSKTMAHAFAAFARTGSPETDALRWPAFTVEDKRTMIFDEECICLADPYKKIHEVVAMMCGDKEGVLK